MYGPALRGCEMTLHHWHSLIRLQRARHRSQSQGDPPCRVTSYSAFTARPPTLSITSGVRLNNSRVKTGLGTEQWGKASEKKENVFSSCAAIDIDDHSAMKSFRGVLLVRDRWKQIDRKCVGKPQLFKDCRDRCTLARQDFVSTVRRCEDKTQYYTKKKA